mgnify:FL=1
MQEVVIEAPYEFIPAHRGRLWPWFLSNFIASWYLRKYYGLRGCEVRGSEKLRASLDAGHGILLPSNHARPCDPMAAAWLTMAVDHPFYCMASRHTFNQVWYEKYLMRRCGAFSINREAPDHASLSFSVESIANADRPIFLFAEGNLTRHNDRLAPLLDGAASIARMAAKRRAKQNPPGKVVVHGLIFKYYFRGSLEETLTPVLDDLDRRMNLGPSDGLSLKERVLRVTEGQLANREREFLGEVRSGDLQERIERFLEDALGPIDAEWVSDEAPRRGNYHRIQRLRSRILPDMIDKKVGEEERARRWKQLAACYAAQQWGLYLPGYLDGDPPPEHLIETVERTEEDLTDAVTLHAPFDVVIHVGDAIEVPTRRVRGQDEDPLTTELTAQMQRMLDHAIAHPPEPIRGYRVVADPLPREVPERVAAN